jgi:microcystin-dependent protein
MEKNLRIAEDLSIDNKNGLTYSPGDIIMLNSDSVPDGFLSCNGATITQNSYPALFSILGTYYDSAGIVCKLPNLNSQAEWIFPCGTVGNEAAYVVTGSSHTHNAQNQTMTSSSYQTAAHNHNSSGSSNSSNSNHAHNGAGGGVGANNSSSVANRSNGSGQGVNLAIAGHSHSWSYSFGINAANHTHQHGSSLGIASAASNHTHNTTLTTTVDATSPYILNNVISMRYYIKW